MSGELERIRTETLAVLREYHKIVKLAPGQILVVGCSTSEVRGAAIGTGGSLDVAESILDSLRDETFQWEVFLAIQCCEHLNRALVRGTRNFGPLWLGRSQRRPGGTCRRSVSDIGHAKIHRSRLSRNHRRTWRYRYRFYADRYAFEKGGCTVAVAAKNNRTGACDCRMDPSQADWRRPGSLQINGDLIQMVF